MGRPASFTAQSVTAAGLVVASRSGWAAVTIRSVAAEVGVSPMALYRVVSDADDLQSRVADLVGRQVTVTSEAPLWAAFREWAIRAHRRLREVSGLTGYVIGAWTELPAWLDIVEDFLARAVQTGMDPHTAVGHVNALFAYTLARAQLGETATLRRRLSLVHQNPMRYPHVAAMRAEFEVARVEEHFLFGLDALLLGLTTKAEHQVADDQ